MRCINCGEDNPAEYRFCGNCGATLAFYQPSAYYPTTRTYNPATLRGRKLVAICAIVAGLIATACAGCFILGAIISLPSIRTTTSASTPLPIPSINVGKQWTNLQVINAFKAAGLEAENPRPLTKEDYGQIPMTAVEGARFFIPSLGGTKGGRVYSFASIDDLEEVRMYYEKGLSGLASPPWIFVKDNILVQINGDLSKELAKQYQAALNVMR